MEQKCQQCYHEFAGNFHAATLICPQQHTICYSCSLDLFKTQIRQITISCPICNKTITQQNRKSFYLYEKCQQKLRQSEKRKKVTVEQSMQQFIFAVSNIIDFGGFNEAVIIPYLHKTVGQSIKSKKYSIAIMALKKLIERNLIDSNQKLFRGFGLIDKQDSSPEKSLQTTLQRYDNSLSLYDLLALCFSIDIHEFKQRMWYKKMLLKDPQNYQINFGLALTYQNCENYEEAMKLYTKIVKMNDKCIKAYQMMLHIYYKTRDIKKCKSLCAKIFEKQPQNLFANMLVVLINPDVSIKLSILNQILSIDPNYIRAISKLCTLSENQTLKLQYSQKCYFANPNNQFYRVSYGLRLLERNRIEEALILLTQESIQKIQSKNYKALTQIALGLHFLNSQKYFSSIYWFQKAYLSDKTISKSYYVLAQSYLQTEQYAKAVDICQQYFKYFKASQQNLYHQKMYFVMVKTSIRMGSNLVATLWINKYLQEIQNPIILHKAADQFFKKKDYIMAKRFYEKCIQHCNQKEKSCVDKTFERAELGEQKKEKQSDLRNKKVMLKSYISRPQLGN